jgi:hypothetical protein
VEEEEDVADKSYGRLKYNGVEYMLPSFLISIFMVVKMKRLLHVLHLPCEENVNIT